ncbi:MAG: sulfatase activating formylglycine-generating enzyme [Myxococcota bacterium]
MREEGQVSARVRGCRTGGRVLIGLMWVLATLLVAESVVRWVTWQRWQAPLDRHPEIAKRLVDGLGDRARVRPEHFFNGPGQFPVPIVSTRDHSAASWTTVDAFPAHGFPSAPTTDRSPDGVVRVAIVGDSVTFDGYPELVEKQLADRYGSKHIEVLNLGVPGSTSETTVRLMQRYLPQWRPHIVVLYTGRNDIVQERIWSQLVVALGLGLEVDAVPSFAKRSTVVGLWGLLTGLLADDLMAPKRQRVWIERTAVAKPISHVWELARLGWQLGFTFYPSTYAVPDQAASTADVDFYETEITYLWPVLGDFSDYISTMSVFNERLRVLGRRLSHLIEVDEAVSGGRDVFRDICHHTPLGRASHAAAVVEAVAPRIDSLLAKKVPPPKAGRELRLYTSLQAPVGGLTVAHSKDGSCVAGPCPVGACFVPEGLHYYGYSETRIDTVVQRAKEHFGFVDRFTWYGDERPSNRVHTSAFCIDRTEAARPAHQQCVADHDCPPFEYLHAQPQLPAIMPTWLDAALFCQHRGGRLPTDAEWDAAARGPTGTLLPWGDESTGHEANFWGPDSPWHRQGDGGETVDGAAAIGTFDGKSVYGAVDMAGNMWEWVGDCFHDRVHEMLPASGARDPVFDGDARCRRFMRGGSHASMGGFLERRTVSGVPDTDVDTRGVRCVYDFGTQHIPVLSNR